jgi:hypothetical protein
MRLKQSQFRYSFRSKRIVIFLIFFGMAGIVRSQEPIRPSEKQSVLPAGQNLKNLPVLAISSATIRAESTNQIEAGRAHRYDHPGYPPLYDPSTVTEHIPGPVLTHRLPIALPLDQSAAVVVGTVTTAIAHLSSSATNVYSVFNVKVTQTIKGSIPIGQSLEFDRSGGIIRFPSGTVAVAGVRGAGIPEIGHSYLFFLNRVASDGSLSLITAYEIRDGLITPLDRISDTIPGPFAQYTGASLAKIISDLTALQANSKGSQQ